jgi:predicted RecB family nuclease
MNDEDQNGRLKETFLGLNKFQFTLACVILCIVAVFVSLGTFAYSVSANSARIADGARRDAAIEELARKAATNTARLDKLVNENRAVFCAQEKVLQAQIVRTADLLIKNQGDTVFGIPRELIEQGLHEDRAQRDAYVGLGC